MNVKWHDVQRKSICAGSAIAFRHPVTVADFCFIAEDNWLSLSVKLYFNFLVRRVNAKPLFFSPVGLSEVSEQVVTNRDSIP